MKIGELLKDRRKELGLTMADVAKACEVSEGTVSRWENGKIGDMKRAKIAALAKVLRIPPSSIICMDDDADTLYDDGSMILSSQEREVIGYYRGIDAEAQDMILTILKKIYSDQHKEEEKEPQPIPARWSLSYGWASASAGSGNEAVDGMSRIEVIDSPEARKADFVVQVKGDSMEPKFHDSDLVLVKAQSDVEVGDIGIWCVDGEIYIKQRTRGGLHSLNPDYDDVHLSEFSDITCYGKVIGKAEV